MRMSAEASKRLDERLEQWSALSRSTLPVDRERATEILCAIYQALGRKRPRVLFLPSPLMCTLAWAALVIAEKEGAGLSVGRPLVSQLEADSFRYLWKYIRHEYAGQLDWNLRMLLDDRCRPFAARLRHLGHLLTDQLHLDVAIGDRPGSAVVSLLPQLEAALTSLEGMPGGLVKRLAQQLPDLDFHNELANLITLNVYWGPWACARQIRYRLAASFGVHYARVSPDPLELWLQQGQCCHWWFPHQDIVLASDRPRTLTCDSRGRLHGERGAALEYRDGYSVFAWHGMRVAARIIQDPQSIRLDEIESDEVDAHTRRVLIARYGAARYLKDSGARLIHEDARGRLWRAERPGDSALVMVEVVNATPEPDGSVRTFFLRVPPECTDATEAIAWTFGMTARRYRPTLET